MDEQSIFQEALGLSDPDQRGAYLENACGDDSQFRQRIDRLLSVHQRVDGFLDKPSAKANGRPPIADGVGSSVGPYRLLEQIGEGGMGVVYRAQQTHPIRREVALKVIRQGMDSQGVVVRFEAERQALALMDHPNIARVLDAGTIDERPYFVMELVAGVPITEFCQRQQLDIRRRLELFVAVCQAVQHAHQKGIIHRDLKPSNVLIATHDGAPVVKVIDFGVAKAVGLQLTERTLVTQCSQLIGTPLYMSPEQAAMSPDVDTRTDVYSLGVLLYELLTGTTPFDTERLKSAGFDEMRRIIREEEPETVGTRLAKTQKSQGGTRSSSANPQSTIRIPHIHELDWIVAKALEKDRNRRYESASALARDIRRYLADEPITARPASVAYRVRKWIRRHPTSAIVATVSSLGILALALGGWYYNHHLNEANQNLNTANHDLNNALTVSKKLQAEAVEREGRLRLQMYADDVRAAWKAWDARDTDEALQLLRRHLPQRGEADLRGFEWHFLFAHYPPPIRTLSGHVDPIIAADVSPDDRWIASGDKGGAVKIWELATGREVQTLQYSMQEITSVRFAPDGRTLATAGVDRTIRIWNVGDWSEAACLRGHELTVASIAWSPDSKQLASGGRDHRVKIWDVESQSETQTLPDYADVVSCVAWSPDGQVVAAGVKSKNGLHLWNAATSHPLRTFQEPTMGDILALAFSADSKRLASSGYGGHIFVHDIGNQTAVAELDAPQQVGSLGFSPDGSRLIAGMFKGGILLCDFDAKDGNLSEPRTIQIGQGHVQAVAFADRGQTVVTALEEGRVVEVRNTAQLANRHRRYRYYTDCITVAPTQDRAVLVDKSGAARLVSFPPKDSLGILPANGRQIKAAAFFPQGDRLATLGDWSVRLYDSATKRFIGHLEPTNDFLGRLTISPDGKYIAGSGGIENPEKKYKVWIWDAESQAIIRSIESPNETVDVRLAFSPDSTLLAMAPSKGPAIVLWNVATGDQIAHLPIGGALALTFSPDGQMLAAADWDNLLLWDVVTRSQVAVLRGHENNIRGLAYSPDGQTLATVDDGGTARLWHVATRRELCTLIRHALPLAWVRFCSPHQLVIGTDPDPQSPSGANDVLVFDIGDPSDVDRNHVLTEMAAAAAYHFDEGDTFVGIKNYAAAITAYTEGIALNPNHAGIHMRRGEVQFRQGAFEQAENDFSAAIEKLRDDDPVRTELPLVRRGFAHCRLLRFDRALVDFEASHEASPVPTLMLLAQGFNGSEVTSALPDARLRDGIMQLVDHTSVPAGDESVAFRRMRATLFAQFGQLQRAWDEYDVVLAADEVSPNDDSIVLAQKLNDHYAAAILAATLQNQAGYRKCCTALTTQFDASKVTAFNSALLSWCCALAPDGLEDYSAAIASARLALSRAPTGSFQRMSLGVALSRAGQGDEGHTLLMSAAAPDVTFSSALTRNLNYLMAISLHHQGQIEKARQQVALGDRSAKSLLQKPHDWRLRLSLELLKGEATKLIGPPQKAKPKSAKKKVPAADKSGKL